MKRLQRLRSLDADERRLLLSASLLHAAIGAALLLLPFRAVRRLVKGLAKERGSQPQPGARTLDQVAWAVGAAGRHLPLGKRCLTQALVAQVLLARRGQPACLRLGVARREDGEFRAHAWIESEGRIVVGGQGAAGYTALPALDLRS